MSELEIKKSEALEAISTLVTNTASGKFVSIHEINILALGIGDLLLDNGATIAQHVMNRGKGKPAIRQRFYEVKADLLGELMSDMLSDIIHPEDTTVDQELPSYLFTEGDDE